MRRPVLIAVVAILLTGLVVAVLLPRSTPTPPTPGVTLDNFRLLRPRYTTFSDVQRLFGDLGTPGYSVTGSHCYRWRTNQAWVELWFGGRGGRLESGTFIDLATGEREHPDESP